MILLKKQGKKREQGGGIWGLDLKMSESAAEHVDLISRDSHLNYESHVIRKQIIELF